MKYTWILVLVAVIVAVYIYVKVVISNVFFKFDLAGISFGDLKDKKTIDVQVSTSVENLNGFQIKFKDLYFELAYKDKVFATIKQKDTKEYVVPARGTLKFTETITLNVNADTINLVSKIVTKQTVKITYAIDVTVFGIKIPTIVNYFNIP